MSTPDLKVPIIPDEATKSSYLREGRCIYYYKDKWWFNYCGRPVGRNGLLCGGHSEENEAIIERERWERKCSTHTGTTLPTGKYLVVVEDFAVFPEGSPGPFLCVAYEVLYSPDSKEKYKGKFLFDYFSNNALLLFLERTYPERISGWKDSSDKLEKWLEASEAVDKPVLFLGVERAKGEIRTKLVGKRLGLNVCEKEGSTYTDPNFKKWNEIIAYLRAYEVMPEDEKNRFEVRTREASYWKSLNGKEFEKEFAFLMERYGYQIVKRVGGSGDGGIDIHAVKDGSQVIIQCKSTKSPIGPGPVRDLYGTMIANRAKRAILASTGGFTEGARMFARGKGIDLIELEHIIQRNLNPSASTQTKEETPLCPKCNSLMKLRYGKFGIFYGCSKYPDCKGLRNIK